MRERRVHAGEAITHRREELGVAVQARKQALESFVHESLESAEELAKLNRKRSRDVGLVET
jgi:hypothetical protein